MKSNPLRHGSLDLRQKKIIYIYIKYIKNVGKLILWGKLLPYDNNVQWWHHTVKNNTKRMRLRFQLMHFTEYKLQRFKRVKSSIF